MDNTSSPLASTAAGHPCSEWEFQVSLLNLMKQGMESPLLVDTFEMALSADCPISLVR